MNESKTMKARSTKWNVLFGLAILAITAVLAAWFATLIAPIGGDPAARGPDITPELIKKGEYLARVGDCTACHTKAGGQNFAGGYAFPTPIGVMYSTNITPDRETGIGGYTYGEFERAVRRGVNRHGVTLYPAMPYPSYARLLDEDVAALYAYFMKGVEPAHVPNRKNDIPWPLSLRWPVTYWRWLFAPETKPFDAGRYNDPIIARGAYLVEGLGHCGACHTPRAITMQEKALENNRDESLYLSGWYLAPSLRSENLSGLGGVSEQEIIAFLKSGRGEKLAAYIDMIDVVKHSMQYTSQDDLRAMARYLKSLPPHRQEPVYAYDGAIHAQLRDGQATSPGAKIYINNCAPCHLTSGAGYGQTFPALAGNPTLNGVDSSAMNIRIILNGGAMPGTASAPTQFAMPPFAWRLSDQDVADVVNFIRTSWGNNGALTTAREVASTRKDNSTDKDVYLDYDPRKKN